ncbi:MAG: hypothetical protein Ta2E_00470 [Mycoplasmoidaceae bacterium]|nr:MAG: hypothetical protein Ta2E_00470 [Mycoplasmoidaceae bacterium]
MVQQITGLKARRIEYISDIKWIYQTIRISKVLVFEGNNRNCIETMTNILKWWSYDQSKYNQDIYKSGWKMILIGTLMNILLIQKLFLLFFLIIINNMTES